MNQIISQDEHRIIFEIKSKYGYRSAVIDADDIEVLKRSWHMDFDKRGNPNRVAGKIMGKTISLGGFLTGFCPVDHIDGDITNNRRHNLRRATPRDNARNRRAHSRSKTGMKGVYIDRKKYRAMITVDYNQAHLGMFENMIDAARAYDAAAVKYFGEFARLNNL